MEMRTVWKILLRWWWLILLPPAAAAAYGLATYAPPAPSYTTSLRFTAGQPEPLVESPNFDPNYYRWLTSEYIVTGLKEWARTGKFAEAVSARLAESGLAVPPAALAGAIAADNARSVLVIYITWGDAAQLPALAQAAAEVLQEQNASVFPQLGGRPAEVVLLDSPGVFPNAPSLRARLDLPLKIGLALLAGLGLALAVHYVDPFVRERSELEAIGLRVVAEIPRRGRAGRRAG